MLVYQLDIMSAQSASVGIATKQGIPSGTPGGGSAKPSAGLGSYTVHKAAGSQRPDWSPSMIDRTDAAYMAGKEFRKPNQW